MPGFITLWCVVDGDYAPFRISVHRDGDITDLKEAIKQQKQNALRDFDATSLVVWMLKDPEPVDPEGTLAQRIRSRGDVATFANQLNSTQIMSALFPEHRGTPLKNHVYVIVSLHSTGPSWLVEIHSELWGRRELFGDIFRTATLTKGDFTDLQCLLEALNPERNSDEYVAKDILTTKSAFLRERSAGLDLDLVGGLVPQPVLGPCQPPSSNVMDEDSVVNDENDVVDNDDDDAVDNDDDVMDNVVDDDDDDDDGDNDGDDDAAMVIDPDTHLPNEAKAIFPYTIRYVDLTGLQSKKELRVPRLMLFRNEWGSMIDIFNKRKKGTGGSALFSGQPGIGKTCMLHSILILCIILAQQIVFQDMDGKVFIIGNTVRPLGAPGAPDDADDVLTLVDADDKVCRPNNTLFHHNEYRILVASSPKKKEERTWLKQRVGLHAMFMMKPWSREELVVASLFLQSNDITLKRLQEASCICGNIPRECFAAAVSSLALRDAEDTIRNAINQTKNLSESIINMRVGGETVIHRVFQIRPLFEDRLWNSCLAEPVSDWAFSEMMDALDNRGAGSAYEFYCAIKGCSDSATLAGKTFENHLHKFLKTSSQTFTIESLDNRSATFEIRFTSDTKHFGDMKCFSGHLALSVKSDTPCYLQPLSPIFPSFDSFLYQPGISQSGFSCLIALQVTTAADHAIKIKGLENVQTSLKPNVSGMKHLRPTIERKMIILFVVPDTLGQIFAKQTIKGAKQAIKGAKKGAKKEKEPLWYRKTAQYILTLSEEEVFKAT